jgi:hypothetical protein
MAHPAFSLLAAIALLIPAAAQPVAAQSRYDGSWSVLIVTDRGGCDPSYRFGVRIVGGRIYDESGSGAMIEGSVTRRGNVRVSVQQGSSSAHGTGQLGDAVGGGTWRGVSYDQQCAGRWRADRRVR